MKSTESTLTKQTDSTDRPDAGEEYIGRADVRELAVSGDPFLRLVAPNLAEELALGRYVRELLAIGRWQQIHVVPHVDGGRTSDHVFDFYGSPRAGAG